MRSLLRRVGFRSAVLASLWATSALISGCAQGVGERCQIQSDCQSGLICSATSPQVGGVCQEPANLDASIGDFAVVDLSTSDAPVTVVDQAPPVDML